jgi:hypothetical protein
MTSNQVIGCQLRDKNGKCLSGQLCNITVFDLVFQIPRAKKRRQSDGEVKQNLMESPALHPEWSMELHRTEGTSTDNSHSDSPRETEDHEGDRSLLEDELEMLVTQ